MKKAKKMERDLIKDFKSQLKNKAFCYHTKASPYGDQGFPDLIVIHDNTTFFIEAKDYDTLALSVKHLSAVQKAMIKKIYTQGQSKVILLYNNGFAIYDKDHWEDYLDMS